MRQQYTLLLLVLLWPAWVTAEELRVLMSFGAEGHRVEKVFKVQSGPIAPQVNENWKRNGQAQGLQFRSANRAVNSGVLVQWLDSAGSVLAEHIIADPRVTHAPTREGPIPDKFLKPTGVYLLNGPADSQQLRLGFPPVTLSSKLIPASSLVLSLSMD